MHQCSGESNTHEIVSIVSYVSQILVEAGDSSWPRICEWTCHSGTKILNRWHKTILHMNNPNN